MTRRQWLAAGLAFPAISYLDASRVEKDANHLGIVAYSFQLRLGAGRGEAASGNINDPLAFLEYCHGLGAGGIQFDFGVREKSYSAKLCQKAENYGMYLEGSIRLPRTKTEID